VIIAVTSKNALKVDAVREAYQEIYSECEVIGFSADSGVGEQPVEEQALEGL